MNLEDNYYTLNLVHLMFVEDEVAVDEDEVEYSEISIRLIADALMAKNVRVKKLDLRLPLSIEDAHALRDALSVNTSVKELSLASMSVYCFAAIAQGIAVEQNVKHLTLESMNGHTGEDSISFQAALRLIMPFVEQLAIVFCSIHDSGARELVGSIHMSGSSSLRELYLPRCYIGNIGAAHLGEALLVNTSLQVINLSENLIGNDGVIALAEGLMNNQSIRVLNLGFCNFGSEGSAALSRLLEANATIEELGIAHNNIGDTGCIALVDGLPRNQGLRMLNLEGCQFGNDGAKRIGRALKTNDHLEKLILEGNHITAEGLEALAEGLSCNTSLLEMDLTEMENTVMMPAIEVYLSANRLLCRYRSREAATISPFLLSIILARVSNHPAVHYLLTREHIPDLLASSSGRIGVSLANTRPRQQDGGGMVRRVRPRER
jgi:Ran GTPase-activating protein (RanGAP) involved in mRNA processing and transport